MGRLVFAYPDIRYPDIRIYPLILWQQKKSGYLKKWKSGCCGCLQKNCVNCACVIVAVLQIIAKATGIRPKSEW